MEASGTHLDSSLSLFHGLVKVCIPFAEEGVKTAVSATAALFGDPDALCRLPGE